MSILTIHAQSGDPLFDEARAALSDPDAMRVYVTVGDKQTVFKPREITIKKTSPTHGYDNPFRPVRSIPNTAVVELWPA